VTATPMLKVIWSPAEFFDPTSTRKRMRRNLVQVYQPMLKIHATLQGKKKKPPAELFAHQKSVTIPINCFVGILELLACQPFCPIPKVSLVPGIGVFAGSKLFHEHSLLIVVEPVGTPPIAVREIRVLQVRSGKLRQ